MYSLFSCVINRSMCQKPLKGLHLSCKREWMLNPLSMLTPGFGCTGREMWSNVNQPNGAVSLQEVWPFQIHANCAHRQSTGSALLVQNSSTAIKMSNGIRNTKFKVSLLGRTMEFKFIKDITHVRHVMKRCVAPYCGFPLSCFSARARVKKQIHEP